MKMRNKIIKVVASISMLYFSIEAHAQQSQIYFIRGKNYNICQSTTFPLQLLKIHKESLSLVKDFIKVDSTYDPDDLYSDTTCRPRKIGIYHSLKLAIVFTQDPHKEKYNFYIIHFANSLKIDTIQRIFSEESSTAPNFYLANINETPYVIFKQIPEFPKKNRSEVFHGINLLTYSDSMFVSNDVIKNLHSEGEQGILINESTDEPSEFIHLTRKQKESQIVYPILYPCLANKELALFDIPNREEFNKIDHKQKIIVDSPNGFFPLQIVNKDFIVCRNNQKYDYENGGRTFSIYDAENQKWHETPYIKGYSFAGIRQFNNWMSGYISFEYQFGYDQKMKKYGEIPGKKYRQQTCKFGWTFDERINMFKQFPIGTLYLYSMKTFKYIEWDALENGEYQGDSEILLVQDEIVYFRINDKIYKAPIINGERLGKAILLIKDNRVPDIHWLFITK